MELTGRLGLNNSAWNTGLAKARADLKQFGADAKKELGQVGKSAGGIGAAGRGLMGALGINVQSISQKIAEAIMGGSEEGFRQMEAQAKELERIFENRQLSRMDADQRLEYYRNQLRMAQANQDLQRRPGESRQEFDLRRQQERLNIEKTRDQVTAAEKAVQDEAARKAQQEAAAAAALAQASEEFAKRRREDAIAQMTSEQRAEIRSAEARRLRDEAFAAGGEATIEGLALLTQALDKEAQAAQERTRAAQERTRAEMTEFRAQNDARKAALDDQLAPVVDPAERLGILRAAAVDSIDRFNQLEERGASPEIRDAARKAAEDAYGDVVQFLGGIIQGGSGFQQDQLRDIGGTLTGVDYTRDPEQERQTVLLESMTRFLNAIADNTDAMRNARTQARQPVFGPRTS